MDQTRRREETTTAKEEATRNDRRKPGRLFRNKPLKSVGSFMNRIIKTLGTLTHLGDAAGGAHRRDTEDDDGGFRDGAPCVLSANQPGTIKEEDRTPVNGGDHHHHHQQHHTAKNAPTASSRLSARERLLSRYGGGRVPGVVGLKNLGNTCFLNAVVQCLSNTDLLAEYLGLERYRSEDRSGRRRIDGVREEGEMTSPPVPVPGGEVTGRLAALVRALWTLEYTPQLSVEFKAAVSRHGAQFRGNAQQDALEFLLWLLDRLHDDLDRLHDDLDHVHDDLDLSHAPSAYNNNNYKSYAPDTAPGPVEGVQVPNPPPAQQQHPSGTRPSFIQEHFQAQYKSSLTCPHCLKQSNTFDPFLCISLPIPLRQTRPVCVVLVFSAKGQRYLRVGVAVPLLGSLSVLRRLLADQGNISPDQVILTELYSSGFQRSFSDEDDLTSMADGDVIYAFQAPPLYIRGGSARTSGYHHSLPSSPYSSGAQGQRSLASGALSSEYLNQVAPPKLLLLVCNAAGIGQAAVRFGPPFLMREDRSISWDHLQQSILSKLCYLMISGAQPQSVRVLFRVRVVVCSASSSYLSPQDARPLHHPAVDRTLRLCGSGGPPHVKLVIEWENTVKDSLFGNIQEEVVKEAVSVREQQTSWTLDQCFSLYTKEEQLAPDDAWCCPHCQQLQQGVVQMSLWTLPDILILHLKRFCQVGERRNKLTTQVHFPLNGLDMAPHVVKRSHCARKQPRPRPPPPQEVMSSDFLYDLYAVCNHHGGMHGGHYTASCRNSVDGRWYRYDDSSVGAEPEEEVCTREAYILFYQRRSSGASCGSDHWLLRLGGASEKDTPPALAPPPDTPPELPVFPEDAPPRPDTAAHVAKPFARGTKGRSLSVRSPAGGTTRHKLSKVLPARWSFGSKDRPRPSQPPPHLPRPSGELVEYLESGRRPRCTRRPIVPLVASAPQGGGDARKTVQGRSPAAGQRDPQHGATSGAGGREPPPRAPEGQSRPGGGGGRGLNGREEEGGPPGRGSNNRTRQDQSQDQGQGRTPEPQAPRGGGLSRGHASHSAPPSRDSTLRRTTSQGGAGHRQGEARGRRGEEGEGERREEGRSHDSLLLSFLKSGFLKRDAPRANGHARTGKPTNGSSPKHALSNGSLNGGVAAALGFKRPAQPRGAGADIKRAHSSSSIPPRPDPGSPRRCASLQRGSQGTSRTPRAPGTDKPSYAPLQRGRYSTTSLGRNGPVPESCF